MDKGDGSQRRGRGLNEGVDEKNISWTEGEGRMEKKEKGRYRKREKEKGEVKSKKRVQVVRGGRTLGSTISFGESIGIYPCTGQSSFSVSFGLRLSRMTNNKHRRFSLMEFLPIKNSLPSVLFARTLFS